MVINENIFAMSLLEEFFAGFTHTAIADASNSAEVVIALSAESKEKVDEVVDRALEAGTTSSNEPTDHGYMYSRSFQDLDGHRWEFIYMDMNAVGQAES